MMTDSNAGSETEPDSDSEREEREERVKSVSDLYKVSRNECPSQKQP